MSCLTAASNIHADSCEPSLIGRRLRGSGRAPELQCAPEHGIGTARHSARRGHRRPARTTPGAATETERDPREAQPGRARLRRSDGHVVSGPQVSAPSPCALPATPRLRPSNATPPTPPHLQPRPGAQLRPSRFPAEFFGRHGAVRSGVLCSGPLPSAGKAALQGLGPGSPRAPCEWPEAPGRGRVWRRRRGRAETLRVVALPDVRTGGKGTVRAQLRERRDGAGARWRSPRPCFRRETRSCASCAVKRQCKQVYIKEKQRPAARPPALEVVQAETRPGGPHPSVPFSASPCWTKSRPSL